MGKQWIVDELEGSSRDVVCTWSESIVKKLKTIKWAEKMKTSAYGMSSLSVRYKMLHKSHEFSVTLYLLRQHGVTFPMNEIFIWNAVKNLNVVRLESFADNEQVTNDYCIANHRNLLRKT
jgi:hypothetical protein